MELFEALTKALGFGLAAGLIAAVAAMDGGRARNAILVAGVLAGAAAGAAAASAADESLALGIPVGLVGALLAWSGGAPLLSGAGRRAGDGGAGGLAFYAAGAALLIAVTSLLWGPLAVPPAIAFAYLAFARRRRDARKHAGLRVLR